MPNQGKPNLCLEMAHLLFMHIVGCSKLLMDEQSEALHQLNQIVRKTEAARVPETAGHLIYLPSGDGMALVFTSSVECALQINQVSPAQPRLPVRPRFDKIVASLAPKACFAFLLSSLLPRS